MLDSNDIHIERKTTFMFEFLADGGIDQIASILEGKYSLWFENARIGQSHSKSRAYIGRTYSAWVDCRHFISEFLLSISEADSTILLKTYLMKKCPNA